MDYPAQLEAYEQAAKDMGEANHRRFKELIESGVKPDPLNGLFKRMGKNENVVMDMRDLPINELIDLYHSAHMFILPSLGEGWGLTLSEAMATGCPCIATRMTGTADFFSESVGYEIDWDYKPVEMEYYKLKANVIIPRTNSTLARFMEAYNDYRGAIQRGIKASRLINDKFTWDKTAKRLLEILSQIQINKEQVAA